jgi:hypothetical protein
MATSKKTAKSKSEAGAKSAAPAKGEKGAKAEVKDAASKRKLGLRGAAPWAARHAAKHAAEARARAAEPPLPGSARATIRTPAKAEDIKQKIADLHNALAQIKGMRKNFHKTFFDVGGVLKEVQAKKLYEAKGYGSFETFLERLTAALLALDVGADALGIPPAAPSGKIPPAPTSSPALPLKPPGR